MRGQRRLISSSFLVFLLPLILVSCSGGGGDTSSPQTPASQPVPTTATLFYRAGPSVVRSDTNQNADTIGGFGSDVSRILVVGQRLILEYTPHFITMESVDFTGSDRRFVSDDQSRAQGDVQGRLVYTVALYDDRRDDDGDFYSVLPDGNDRRRLTTLPRDPNGNPQRWGMTGSMGSLIIFGLDSPFQDLLAVPVMGGPVVTLANGPEYEWFGAVAGNRIVYHSCAVDAAGKAGQCDLASVLSDGTGRITLSTHPRNERVQGAIGGRVLVRRNSGGTTDELYSLAPDGAGGETSVTQLRNADEFVVGTTANWILLQRGTRLWTMQADGSNLRRLTDSQVPESFAGVVGDWIVTYRKPNGQYDLWAVPVVGDGPPVVIAQTDVNEIFIDGL